MRTSVPGVATWLAWTPVGGDILFIEATRMPGKGKLVLTGQLGDVMKESVTAALSFVRGRAAALGLDPGNFLENTDLHVHVPAGAVPKDGPSAGVTMYTALVSLLCNIPVRPDVAMTGEITLRGNVLQIGGLKEKLLAAHRAGIKRVIIPDRNMKDLVDVPEEVKKEIEILPVKRMDQVLVYALSDPPQGIKDLAAQEE
jgi:ATP-dependent Lon protease